MTSKAEEKDLFAQWVDSLGQDTYLRPMMRGIQVDVERAIDDDFAVVDFTGFLAEQAEKRKILADLSDAVTRRKAELQKLDRQVASSKNELDEIRRAALRIWEVKT